MRIVRMTLLSILVSLSVATAQWGQKTSIHGGSATCLTLIGTNMFAGTSNGVFLSTDQGASWTPVNSGMTDSSINALAAIGTTLFAATGRGSVYRSTNNGAYWILGGWNSGGAPVYALAVIGTKLFMGTQGGGVVVSTDSGTTWNPAGSTGNLCVALKVIDTTIYARINAPGFLVSTDQGKNWTNIAVGFANTNVIDAIGSNLFIGTPTGVQLSTDNGTTWNPASSGLPGTRVNAFAVAGTNIFAAPGGNGVYLSTDTGNSWNPVNTGLTDTTINFFTPAGLVLYASGNGLWYRRFSEMFVPARPQANPATSPTSSGFTANWNASAFATQYRLDVATDNTFLQILTAYNNLAVSASPWAVTGLNAGTMYYYRVRAEDYAGVSANSNTITVPTIPPAPLAIAANNQTTTSFTAQWNSSTGATGYLLDVASDNSFTQILPAYNNLSVAGVSKSVTGLGAGTTYWYRVRAENASGPSGYSNRIAALTLPPAPVAIQASAISNTAFTANWNAAQSATSYWLDVATDSAFAQILSSYNSLPVSGVSQIVSGLGAGASYYYRVRAQNASGTSVSSNTIIVQTIPPAPLATAATNPTSNGFTATWNPAPGATAYRLDVATDSAVTQILTTYNNLLVSGVNQIVSGLGAGITYYYRVRAQNSSGTSVSSNTITIQTVPPAPVANPATNPTATGFTATWNSATGAAGYRLDVATDINFAQILSNYNNLFVMGVSQVVTGLSPGTTYYYRVRAENTSGASANSNQITAATSSTGAPSANAASAVSTTGFTANWSLFSGATGYRLDVATDNLFTQILAAYNNLAASGLSQVVSGLSAGTSYYYRVRAETGSGTTGNSNTITALTIPAAPLATAPGAISSSGFTAQWNSSTGAAGYQLDVATDTAFTQILSGYNSLPVSALAQVVTGLSPATTYSYRVRAQNASGPSANSNRITVTTTSVGVPAAIAATSVGATSFTANWDTVGGATGYRLDVATDNPPTQMLGGYNNLAVAGVSAPVSGLSPGTTYYYQVRSVIGGVSSASSNVVAVITVPGAPSAAPPSNITSSAFTANWNAVAGVTDYRLDVATDNGFTLFVSGFSAHVVGNVTSAPVSGLQDSTTYYYRVRAENQSGMSSYSNTMTVMTLALYPATYTIHDSVSFGSANALTDYHSQDYQLIGLPGNSGQMIGNYLSGTQGQNWQLYWDNGTASAYPNYYVKFSAPDTNFRCLAGKAFWLLHLGNWTLGNQQVPTAPVDSALVAMIGLRPGGGWNLITNPFTKSIPWATITTLNGISDSITSWSPASGWRRASNFDPYRGYLFFNGNSLPALRIPLTAALGKPSARPLNDWRIDVVVRCGQYRDETTALGVSAGALKGMDAYEQRKVRHLPSIPDIYFDHPDWDSRFREFATDIRPGGGDLEEWELTLRSDEMKPVEVEFQAAGEIPGTQAVVLLDEYLAHWQDLRREPKYALQPSKSVTTLKVLVGDPVLVKARVDRIMPREYALLQNYPNPFNPSTTIPLLIPGEGHIVLEIYNILGQKVKTLYDGEIQPGRHSLQWDATDDAGKHVSSGIYVCQLRAPGGVRRSGKLNLIR